MTADDDRAWTFEAVTFKKSKTGGSDRGYANRIRTAVANAAKVDVATVGASVKRTGDTVTAVAYRRKPTDAS
jgi:hypothetical protein